MTTPPSSSPAPNTVIQVNPLDGPLAGHLAAAVHGHAGILSAVLDHAERAQLRRLIAREARDREAVSRGQVGGDTAGAGGAAAGS